MLLLKPKNQFKGMDTSAYGVYEFLMDVIKREKPDHLAVAFDKGGANCEMISSEYKTSRRHT
jgi:DNA polymerase-1